MSKIKKKYLIIISVLIPVIIVSIFLGFNIFKKPKSIDDLILDLDSNFIDLDTFELDAPFDLSKLSDYRLVSTSSPEHMGIDFFSNTGVSSIPFLSMIDGIVTRVEPWVMENQGETDNWAYRIIIAINSKYVILLNFETFAHTEEIKQLQENNIFVKEGDLIKKGKPIGNLIIGSQFAHVHYSLKLSNIEIPDSERWLVPEPYFSNTAVELINNVFGYQAIDR